MPKMLESDLIKQLSDFLEKNTNESLKVIKNGDPLLAKNTVVVHKPTGLKYSLSKISHKFVYVINAEGIEIEIPIDEFEKEYDLPNAQGNEK